jgi:hypothetical protein
MRCAKFVYLTVLVQEPKMSYKMHNKWHVMKIFRVLSVLSLMVAISRNMLDLQLITTLFNIYSVGIPYMII